MLNFECQEPEVLDDTLLLSFPEYTAPANRLAKSLSCPCEPVDIHRFPDGESRVQIPANLPGHVILCRSLNHPNDKLIELLLTAETARAAGAKHLTLVAPYLCYMRQDMAFHPGEAVSQRIVGRWLAGLFDTVITVNAHLHRIRALNEAVPAKRSVNLSASRLVAGFLRQRIGKALLVGPDSESEQWVGEIANLSGMEYLVAEKQRFSDKDVHIQLPSRDLRGRIVVIVDDMASTARTLAVTAEQLRGAGASEIHCCITHAIFAEDAETILESAGIGHVWSTDSVLHCSNAIELCELLGEALKG
ncbi:MAG: ribose-phosphate diphosphokinase [Gammaproteobacteria bacterium]